MNHPDQYGQRTRTRRGPNFFLLFMMAMMAFFLYTQYQSSRQQAAKPDTPQAGVPHIQIPDISNDDKPSGWPAPNGEDSSWRKSVESNPHGGNANSDWSIEDIPTNDPNQTVIDLSDRDSTSSNDSVTTSGDWSIEEGDSRSITPNVKVKPSAPKTTRKGDWSVGEVETSPK